MSERALLSEPPDLTGPTRVLTDPIEHELVIQKSRFIAFLSPVGDVAQADGLIRERRALHPSARHTCTALALGIPVTLQRSNDDGEPSGTAGMPMASALRGRELTNCLAVVTRYFGGIKLGAGGLTRAYSSAVTEAVDAALAEGVVRSREVREVSRVHAGYEVSGPFEASLRAWAEGHGGVRVDGTDFGADGARFTIVHTPEVSSQLEAAVAELSSGAARRERAGWTLTDVPVDPH